MRRVSAALRIVLAGLTVAGCATLSRGGVQARTERVVVRGATFDVVFDPVDERAAKDIIVALAVAVPRLSRWGTFRAPMSVRIHPTHDALEVAVRRVNYPWLRAWARFDTIDVQSPRTWSLLGASQAQLVELLTHELTHCLMYQLGGTASDWTRKGIPLWFREGMASVTAAQGYRRPTDEELWRYLRAHPGQDPVSDADDLYQSEAEVVYGAAHRAFDFLVTRYGDEVVKSLMEEMSRGSRFAGAFRRQVGLDEKAFAAEYVRFVRLEGWRGQPSRNSGPLVPPPPGKSGAAGAPPRT